jgi:hypothetical protein
MGSCGGALEPGFAPAATATSNPAMIREAAPIGVVIERNPAVEVDLPRPALAPLFQIEPKRGAVQPMRVDVP